VNDHHVTTGELASLACTHHASGIPGYTCCSAQDDCSLWSQNVLQRRVTDNVCADGAQANDRWIDMLRACCGGRARIEHALDTPSRRADFDLLRLRNPLNKIVNAGHLGARDLHPRPVARRQLAHRPRAGR
jgi:hypothetical protein